MHLNVYDLEHVLFIYVFSYKYNLTRKEGGILLNTIKKKIKKKYYDKLWFGMGIDKSKY